MNKNKRATLVALGSLAGLAWMVAACGRDDIDVSKKAPEFTFFTASNFDLCLSNPSVCLEAMSTGNLESLLEGVRLVKLEPTSRVYRDVDARRIRTSDLRTLEGSGFFTALSAIAKARAAAKEAGFALPANVAVDPFCTMPFAENNAFFRNTYGYESATGKTELQKVICLGLFFDGKKLVSLANDRFVVTHEFFHSLMAEAILGRDKTIPDAALSYSHDLDSFNEGGADFFAEKAGSTALSRVFGAMLPWRTTLGRKTAGPGIYANIYRDGTRYTEVFARLDGVTPALPVLACTVRDIGAAIRRAKSDAAKTGAYYGYDVYAVDILDGIKRCAPASVRPRVEAIVAEVFPEPRAAEKLATSADLSVVVVPTQRSLCGLQRIYSLSPTDLRKYHSLDACAGSFLASWQGDAPLKMAREDLDEYGLERRKFETVYVVPGVRLDGEASDCRLRGLTNVTSPEDALTTEIAPGKIGTRFHNVIFQPLLRGSWYRDVAFGDFLSGRQEVYDLRGPLRPLTVGENAVRFVSAPTAEGRPTVGMNGYFWLPIADLEVKTRAEKNARLAQWVKQTLSPYSVDPNTNEACREGGPCVTVQNYDLVCRSHATPMSQDKPQPGAFAKIPFSTIHVHVLDCEGDERSCKLESF